MMEAFEEWRKQPDNHSPYGDEDSEENFSIFYQHLCFGKGFVAMLADLAYQVYELQVCMEGVIEDMEK